MPTYKLVNVIFNREEGTVDFIYENPNDSDDTITESFTLNELETIIYER